MNNNVKLTGLPKIVGGYIISGKTLGLGTTGEVKLAFHKETGERVAIKIIPKRLLLERGDKFRQVEREIAVMKLTSHPHVLDLIDVYETSQAIFLVEEYVSGGELFEQLYNFGAPTPNDAMRYFFQILHGVYYCHRHNICHRDLKPENILLDGEDNIKIGDFGMARLMQQQLLLTSCGSPHYAAPEVVRGVPYDGKKADIWSCGVILFALWTGKLPFDDPDIRKLLYKVKNGAFIVPQYLPRDVQDLITSIIVVDPEERPTIPEILHSPVLKYYNRKLGLAEKLAQQMRLSTSSDERQTNTSETWNTKLLSTYTLHCATPIGHASEIDSDVVNTLVALGCGSYVQVCRKLFQPNSDELNFYRLVAEKKFYNHQQNEKKISQSSTKAPQPLSLSSSSSPSVIKVQKQKRRKSRRKRSVTLNQSKNVRKTNDEMRNNNNNDNNNNLSISNDEIRNNNNNLSTNNNNNNLSTNNKKNNYLKCKNRALSKSSPLIDPDDKIISLLPTNTCQRATPGDQDELVSPHGSSSKMEASCSKKSTVRGTTSTSNIPIQICSSGLVSRQSSSPVIDRTKKTLPQDIVCSPRRHNKYLDKSNRKLSKKKINNKNGISTSVPNQRPSILYQSDSDEISSDETHSNDVTHSNDEDTTSTDDDIVFTPRRRRRRRRRSRSRQKSRRVRSNTTVSQPHQSNLSNSASPRTEQVSTPLSNDVGRRLSFSSNASDRIQSNSIASIAPRISQQQQQQQHVISSKTSPSVPLQIVTNKRVSQLSSSGTGDDSSEFSSDDDAPSSSSSPSPSRFSFTMFRKFKNRRRPSPAVPPSSSSSSSSSRARLRANSSVPLSIPPSSPVRKTRFNALTSSSSPKRSWLPTFFTTRHSTIESNPSPFGLDCAFTYTTMRDRQSMMSHLRNVLVSIEGVSKITTKSSVSICAKYYQQQSQQVDSYLNRSDSKQSSSSSSSQRPASSSSSSSDVAGVANIPSLSSSTKFLIRLKPVKPTKKMSQGWFVQFKRLKGSPQQFQEIYSQFKLYIRR